MPFAGGILQNLFDVIDGQAVLGNVFDVAFVVIRIVQWARKKSIENYSQRDHCSLRSRYRYSPAFRTKSTSSASRFANDSTSIVTKSR